MRMKISDSLRSAMEKKGYSQYSLSMQSGVPQPTIQRILSGETSTPQVPTLNKLAEALHIKPMELIGSMNASGNLITVSQSVHQSIGKYTTYEGDDGTFYTVEFKTDSKKGQRLLRAVSQAVTNEELTEKDISLLLSMVERLRSR